MAHRRVWEWTPTAHYHPMTAGRALPARRDADLSTERVGRAGLQVRRMPRRYWAGRRRGPVGRYVGPPLIGALHGEPNAIVCCHAAVLCEVSSPGHCRLRPLPDYLGLYFCGKCLVGERHLMPARVLHNWDLRQQLISRRSRVMLSYLYVCVHDSWRPGGHATGQC
jgi:hypothetical protein